jgi:hypothetical protein
MGATIHRTISTLAATWHFLATMGAIARWTLVAAAFVTILIMTWELMAVLRAVFLGQIEGRPMGVARLSRHLAMTPATNRAQAARAPKARARFNAMGAGSSFLWIVLISLAMAETLQRLILMIHKASVKLPKTGLNKLTVIDCGCVYRESRCGRNDDEASREPDVSMLLATSVGLRK